MERLHCSQAAIARHQSVRLIARLAMDGLPAPAAALVVGDHAMRAPSARSVDKRGAS